MQEQIDTTNQYDNSIPDGTYDFRIENIKKITKSGVMYVFQLSFKGVEERETGEQIMFPNQMGPLLRVLGCEELSKDKFNWDPDNQAGRHFIATVISEPNKKGDIRQNMKDFKKSDVEDDVAF